MSGQRGNPNIPGNRSQYLNVGVPNLGCQILAGTGAAGDSTPINSPALYSACSTPSVNAMHESSAPQAAPSSSMNRAAEGRHAGPAILPSWNLPAGCTQVPINIIVLHRQLIGRGLRPLLPRPHGFMPASALPAVSEGASIQLAGRDFLSLGRPSNIVAGDMAMNPSQPVTPEVSEPQRLVTTNFCDSPSNLESVLPGNTLETQIQHPQESASLLAEGSADASLHMDEPVQKRSKMTQMSQSEHTPLSTPAVLKEKTLTPIKMQTAGAERTETLRNEETPAPKPKTRRKRHRAKVIREGRAAKVQKPVNSTPDRTSPNQKVKRSYVRKKKSLSSVDNCSGPSTDQSVSRGTEIAARRTPSARRSLQFVPEEQEVQVQGDHSSTANSHHYNYERFVDPQNSFCPEIESEEQIGSGLQIDMENSPGGLAFGMSLKMNKFLDEYIHLPEVPLKPTQEVPNETSGSFSREQDNVETHGPHTTRKSGLCIEERAGMTTIEGDKKDLELYCSADYFHCSAWSSPEMESTRSQSMVSKVENHTPHNNGESSLTGTRDSIILRTAAKMVALCQAGGIKKKRTTRVRRSSFNYNMDPENNNLQASTRLPHPCMDALCEKSYIKFTTKKRSQKSRTQCPSSIQPNVEVKNRLSYGSIFYGGSDGSQISEGTFKKSSLHTLEEGTFKKSSLHTLDDKSINLDIHCKVPEGSSASTSTVPYMDCLQGVASKMKHLDLNTEQVHRTEMHLSLTMPAVISFGETDGLSNTLVPYGDGLVVPYERPLQLVKRQRPRAKVDLDFETTRVWNLLMGKATEPVDGTDAEKERWWQQEREVFQGRANSFTARMRLVQGDRRFSPWKGSVVDSVVGVFLTQNVADHLSSSAYMALAATFPSRSVDSSCGDNATTQDNIQTISTGALGGKNMLDFFYNGARPDIGVSCEELSMMYEKIHMESKDSSSADEVIKGEDYSFDYKSEHASVCDLQGTGIEHKAHQSSNFSLVDLTASTEVLQQIQFHKDISSSQSVTSEILESALLDSSGLPRNFVGGGSCAAHQQLGGHFDHGKSFTGNVARTSEIECQRLKIAVTNDDGVNKHGITSDSMVPFILTGDPQQQDLRNETDVSSISPNSSSGSASPYLKNGTIETNNPLFRPGNAHVAERSGNENTGATFNSPKDSTDLTVKLHLDKNASFGASDLQEHESPFVTGEMTGETRKEEEILKSGSTSYNEVPDTSAQASRSKKTRDAGKKNTENIEWDKLRRQVLSEGCVKERSFERRDSVDWEAVRCADVKRISHAIRERGMNNVLAERIQNFLNRLVRDHGSIDLEWLRDIPPDSAKDYLLSIRGLGLKSVECVRLLTLHHLAFPVDTNVGRICVRLGWVPIQPLPESLQLHLLELYPILETIQKYLWPRLCKLDQQTLYELHYHMITFGKVFCTKSKPNCNACPMRSECKHFASAFASTRLALPAPQEKSLVKSSNQFGFQNSSMHPLNLMHLPRLEGGIHAMDFVPKNSEPIIEEPASPKEEECPETVENDIEDFDEDGEIPTIKLNMEAFAQNLESCIKQSNKELQSDDIAKALVTISTETASIPVPKLKNVHRLRTEHYVYELPDSHPLVQQLGLDQREPDDPSPYLLAIWTPAEIKEISKASKPCCDCQIEGGLYNNEMCRNCIAEQEIQSRYVRGTILVPCRTAMRGSFPLNGTYFQVNEVFADHKSSHNPIHVERDQLWNLQRRMVFFGTSVPTIFKGLTTEEIQHCFWRGFVCVRGFDMEFRTPRPLCPHLHVVARPNSRKTASTEQVL